MSFICDKLSSAKQDADLVPGLRGERAGLGLSQSSFSTDIAGNRRFQNLYEIWLESDHYKWRPCAPTACRNAIAAVVPLPMKNSCLARTVPYTLRNPLYHWTHLELKALFRIEDLLDENSAQEIWKRANALLASDELSVHGILKRFHIRALARRTTRLTAWKTTR